MAAGVALSVLKSEWHRRIGWIMGVALTIALGGGVSIGSMVIAHRTDRAYPDYVDRADVADLVINPSLSTTAMDQAIRHLDGVASVHSNTLFLAGPAPNGRPTPPMPLEQLFEQAAGDDYWLQVRGSTDGDFVDADRPVVTSGRLPTGDHEVFVSDSYHAQMEKTLGRQVHLGDTIPLEFFWSPVDSDELPLDEIVAPIGFEPVRVVGFGRLADEPLPDELYPRDRLIVSSDVAAKYSCTLDPSPTMTAEQVLLTLLVPKDCSMSFVYYSMTFEPSSDVTSVRTAYDALVEQLTQQLSPALRAVHGYESIAQARSDLDEAVRQTTRPTVTTLIVFGTVAGLATLTLVGLLISRNLRRTARDRATLLSLGATDLQRTRAAMAGPAVAMAGGLIGAVLVAAAVSPIGPVGSVRRLQPHPGFALPGSVLLPALAIGIVSLTVMLGTITLLATRRSSAIARPATASVWRAKLLDHGSRPSVTTGLRATLGSNGSWANGAVLVGCVVSIAAVAAAAVFGSNLSTLVTQPQRYGWFWDAAVGTNAGYGQTDVAAVQATLDGNPDVTSYAFYAFDSSSRIDGHPMPAIYGLTPGAPIDLPIVGGRPPAAAGEAVIGTSSAERFGFEIGDRVTVESSTFEADAVQIVGTAVLPTVGLFQADRSGLGTGIFIVPAAARLPQNQNSDAFTGISLRAGVDPGDFVQRIGDQLPTWSVGGAPPLVYSSPVRPPEIVNVSEMRSAPLILGGVLAVALLVGLALALAVSVRERRREFAILRTLGFSGRTLYSSVAWQVISMVAIGLIVGLPLGVIGGRFAWHTFADQLGVVPRADISMLTIVVIAATAIVLSVLAAALPARTAARVAPGDVLRDAS